MEYEIDVESDSESVISLERKMQDKCARKCDVLVQKCEGIQKENSMLIHRILRVKKRIKRLRKERKFLIETLDKYGDNFRDVPLNIGFGSDLSSFESGKSQMK